MKNLTLKLYTLISFLPLFSCVSTDTIEPTSPKKGESRIVVNLVSEDNESTRADNHDGYKLRYIAKLYSGRPSSITQAAEPQRKEIIEGDLSEFGVKNQLVFNVDKGNYYTLYVFADYIPQNSKPNSETGLYDDYFYDTNNSNLSREVIRMLPYPGDKSSIRDSRISSLSANFFNNDNYDCFGGVVVSDKEKTEEKMELDIKLYRLTSKIRFVDITNMKGKLNAVVKSLKYFSQFTIAVNKNDASGFLPVSMTDAYQNVYSQKDFAGEDDQELLYFYSFASSDRNQTPSISFTLSDGGDENKDITMESIPVKRNQITTVKGYLFPGYIPPVEPGDGPLILNSSIDSNETWESSTTTWTQK